MSVIQTIQDELITLYEAITLPNSLGVPTGYKHEPEGGLTASDLPAVVVTRGVLVNQQNLSSDRKLLTREFIVDLYCYVYNDSDPVNTDSRNNTSDCIDTIHGAFDIYGLNTSGVMFHDMNADTGDTEIFARDNTTNYIGVRFRHQVTYLQEL